MRPKLEQSSVDARHRVSSGPVSTIRRVNAVALAATIGGAAVGIVTVIANVVLAAIRRGHDVELAEKQHAHERELSRGDRLYERRAPVYESMMKVVQPVMEHVERRNPIWSSSSDPPLPPEPTIDDQRAVQIELRTHGSKAVGDAFQDWVNKVRQFQFDATAFESIERRGEGQPVTDARLQMDASRDRAREAADTLARLVSDELASF
jgi:hypothetical protein